jgi:ferric-dicitrate binding protein FerR (iron transport regulator)
MSHPLNKLLAEVRRDLGTVEAKTVDWTAVDAALFARIGEAQRAERARFAPQRRRGVTLAAVTLAAAAVLAALIGGKTREPIGREGTAVAESAGTIVAIDGDGRVLVNGAPVSSGTGLGLGDMLETRGVQATIERPGKLSLTLEAGSRTTVVHVRGALVVALESGAIEAQVAPVAAGEAFAVDVGNSRVAVHGTRLRVARAGERVVVDLNEGVISVGEAPRLGSVEGATINAPAHVEFMAGDALGTLTQTHDPAAVRGGDMRSHASTDSPMPRLSLPKPESSASRLGATSSADGRPEPRLAPGVGTKPALPIERSPTATITNTVRTCMAERPRADNVTVVVRTELHLELADDGSVRTARFEPPVAPDVNACATPSIYRSRFAHGGSITIPIDFTN